MLVAAGVVILFLVVWTLVGYLPTRGIEKPAHTVIRQASGYEIREYAPRIHAEVTVAGTYGAALNAGFRKVADYIFGNNKVGDKVAMTSPVLSKQTGGPGGNIAMTAPVLHNAGTKAGTHVIAFVMPSEYTMATLPQPTNPEVKLVEVSAERYAVLKFRGYATARRVAKKTAALNRALERDGVEPTGRPVVAQYDPPWTPPYMRRNEIWCAVRPPEREGTD